MDFPNKRLRRKHEYLLNKIGKCLKRPLKPDFYEKAMAVASAELQRRAMRNRLGEDEEINRGGAMGQYQDYTCKGYIRRFLCPRRFEIFLQHTMIKRTKWRFDCWRPNWTRAKEIDPGCIPAKIDYCAGRCLHFISRYFNKKLPEEIAKRAIAKAEETLLTIARVSSSRHILNLYHCHATSMVPRSAESLKDVNYFISTLTYDKYKEIWGYYGGTIKRPPPKDKQHPLWR